MQCFRARVLQSDFLDLNLAPLLTSRVTWSTPFALLLYLETEGSGFLTPVAVLLVTTSCSLDLRASKDVVLVRRVA